MSDQDLAIIIRGALGVVGLDNGAIDALIAGELKEAALASNAASTQMTNNATAFRDDLDHRLTQAGAVWSPPVYNLAGLGLTMGVKMVATEELAAIRTHAGTPGFDGAKAVTNMLRIVKAIER